MEGSMCTRNQRSQKTNEERNWILDASKIVFEMQLASHTRLWLERGSVENSVKDCRVKTGVGWNFSRYIKAFQRKTIILLHAGLSTMTKQMLTHEPRTWKYVPSRCLYERG